MPRMNSYVTLKGFATIRITSEGAVIITCSKNEQLKCVLHVTMSDPSAAELGMPCCTAELHVFTECRFIDGCESIRWKL